MIPYQVARSNAVAAMKQMTESELFAEIKAEFPPREFFNGVPIRFIDFPSEKTIKRYGGMYNSWIQNSRTDPNLIPNANTFNSHKAAVIFSLRSKFNELLIRYHKFKVEYESKPAEIQRDLQIDYRMLQQIKAMNFVAFCNWHKAATNPGKELTVLPSGALSKKRTVVHLPEDFQRTLFQYPYSQEIDRTITAIGLLGGVRCAEVEMGIMIGRENESTIQLTVPCAKDRRASVRYRFVRFQVGNDLWSKHLETCVPQIGDQVLVKKTADQVSDLGRRLGKFLKIPGKHNFSFYTLRHHFIAAMRRQGLDPGEIALLAGHISLNSQYRYGADSRKCKVRLIQISLTAEQNAAAESIKSASSQYKYQSVDHVVAERDSNQSMR